MNIQLQVNLPSGDSVKLDITSVFQTVLQGGEHKRIAVPVLDIYDRSYDYMSKFTGYRGAFETVHYCYVEGEMTTGEIESSDDEILATWKFLVNGLPVDFDQLKEALEFRIGITKSKKLETYESNKTIWYCIDYFETDYKGVSRSFCADGDGIVEIREINGFYNLVDQGTHISKTGSDLPKALQVAENYLHTHYRGIFDDCRK
jgi:hypothetical protein